MTGLVSPRPEKKQDRDIARRKGRAAQAQDAEVDHLQFDDPLGWPLISKMGLAKNQKLARIRPEGALNHTPCHRARPTLCGCPEPVYWATNTLTYSVTPMKKHRNRNAVMLAGTEAASASRE